MVFCDFPQSSFLDIIIFLSIFATVLSGDLKVNEFIQLYKLMLSELFLEFFYFFLEILVFSLEILATSVKHNLFIGKFFSQADNIFMF